MTRHAADPHAWPRDYVDGRERFVASALAAGARTDSLPAAATGPGGEPLSVDVATLGPDRPEHRIVLTSALHGVEGALGARIQVRALEALGHEGLPDGVGVTFVHAVNPWGFAHGRRVDEDNVDVNRNFLDPKAPRPPANPAYAALDPLINPRGEPPADGLRFRLGALGLIARERGAAPLARAIAEGQDRFPKGLFFAGTAVGESARRLSELLVRLSGAAGRITHLDLHSGLGPSGTATLIGATGIGAVEGREARLRAHFGQPVRLDDAPGNAYDAHGTLARRYRSLRPDGRFLYLCVEIGTVGPLAVLAALRRENRAHHWGVAGSTRHAEARRALRDAFCPPSRRWRERAVGEGVHAFRRALALPIEPAGGP